MHEIRKIHSDMIVLIIAVLSAYNIDNKIVHAQVSIETHGNIKAGNSIVLECKVTSFGNTGATWSQDNGITILTQCIPAGICTDTGSGNYQYTSDSNGINVTISLTASELGKTWTCTHASFNSSKTVSTSEVTTEGPTEGASSNASKNCGLNAVFCVLGALLGSAIVIGGFLCICPQTRKNWTIFLKWTLPVSLLCVIAALLVCYICCVENELPRPIIAFVIALLITGIVAFLALKYIETNDDVYYNGLIIFNILSILGFVILCYELLQKNKVHKKKAEVPIFGVHKNEAVVPISGGYKNKAEETNPEVHKNKAKVNTHAVTPEHVMLLGTTVDKEKISDCLWISEKGDLPKEGINHEKKYNYSRSLKVPLAIHSLSKEDSGIYQCVRTLLHGEKDKINVVLYVTGSDVCSISLIVNPFVWTVTSFEDLHPVDLKKNVTKFDRNSIHEVMEAINSSHDIRKAYSVDWECSSKLIEKGESKEINGFTILKAFDAGEYKCTVDLNNQTYVFIFHIHLLDSKNSQPETDEHVFGVPSLLNSYREKSKTGWKQKTNHTGTP